MTTYTAAHRFMMTMVLAALLVLGLAPAALAQTQERVGWERTSTSTGQSDSGQVTQSSGIDAPAEGLRGWEATGTATGTSPRVAGDDAPTSTPPASFSPSPTLLYVAAVVGALALAFGGIRLMRPHGGRHGVA